MKTTTTQMSRFPIHDELTAPEPALGVLRGALGRGGRLPNLLGVLAGSPAALRGYVRLRAELRGGHLPPATLARIALGVAEHHGAPVAVQLHARTARAAAGLSREEVDAARRFTSADPREAALLAWVGAVVTGGRPPMHLHEAAREHGWTDAALVEALAAVGLETFTALVHVAGDVPADAPSAATPPTARSRPRERPRPRALRAA